MKVSRRQFLGTSAAAVIVAGTMAKGKVFGANDRIAVCCMGINGRGTSHINDIIDDPVGEVVALCDVDSKVLEGKAGIVKNKQKSEPKLFRDIRDALADKSIDAITVATPNHWHSLATIWACKAGKDVYVEKPLSHSLWEGRQLVAAAEKYGRIVQHGTQSRADTTLIRDIKMMHDGFIGDIVHSRGYVYKNGNRGSIGRGKPSAPPANLDWTLWQGPSPEHDYLKKEKGDGGLQVHYNWHWFWLYGNGEIGNQGVHEMDIACWGHNVLKRGLPVKAMSQGGRYGLDDDGETPNTQATSFTYADGTMMTFEVRNLGSYPECGDEDCSNSFFGTKGYYQRGVGFFDYKKKPIQVDAPKPEGMSMFAHFFKAMRSRKQEDCPMTPLDGSLSCAHIHIGNIAYRLGRSVVFDPKAEKFVSDEEANGMVKRVYREGFEPEQLV